MEFLGFWHEGKWSNVKYGYDKKYKIYDYKVYIDDDGILRLEECSPCFVKWGDVLPLKKVLGGKYFGDESFLVGAKESYVSRILNDCCGRTQEEVDQIIDRYKLERCFYQNKRYEEQLAWEELREKFNGFVIGLDKRIDVYNNGFSVRVLFDSDVSFAGRKKFLHENRNEFLKWVINEISKSQKMIKKIGDIRFYKPVEIINLRASEVEVKFEVKEVAA